MFGVLCQAALKEDYLYWCWTATPWNQAQAEYTQSVAPSWNFGLKRCSPKQTNMLAVMLMQGMNPSMVLSAVPWACSCSLGWLWRSTSGSMLGSKGCRKRRWKRRWSRWQWMLVCLTNWKLGQANCLVGSAVFTFLSCFLNPRRLSWVSQRLHHGSWLDLPIKYRLPHNEALKEISYLLST